MTVLHAPAARVRSTQTNSRVLSDPGAVVVRQYGLLHPHGKGDEDIAVRTTFLPDEDGRERWRRVSTTIPDIAKPKMSCSNCCAMK